MKNSIFVLITLSFVLTTSAAFGFGGYGTDVNTYCPSPDPYTGDCTLCHTGSKGNPTPMKDAYIAGTLEYFCPAPVDPNTIDDDGDGYSENQGDCNDTIFSINPGATEILSNGIDENCNGMADDAPVITDTDNDGVIDDNDNCPNTPAGTVVDANGCALPPADTDNDGVIDDNDNCPNTPAGTVVDAKGCEIVIEPPVITDVDGDGFDAISSGGNDCNDEVAAINPGSAERCGDNIDNNCDGLTDGQDTQACPAPSPTCTDDDGDKFYAQADCNTVQDCNDNDGQIFPGATELCGDAIDNDCDGNVDENCDIANENDGAVLYQNLCASCHGELTNTELCGKDAENIMGAIKDNKGGMSALSPLTDTQVEYIAEALSNCNKDEGGDSDHSDDHRGPHEKGSKDRPSKRDK